MRKATGRGWEEWFALLDAAGARPANAAVARPAKFLRRVAAGFPIAHGDQKFDDDRFKEAGAILESTIQEVCRKRSAT